MLPYVHRNLWLTQSEQQYPNLQVRVNKLLNPFILAWSETCSQPNLCPRRSSSANFSKSAKHLDLLQHLSEISSLQFCSSTLAASYILVCHLACAGHDHPQRHGHSRLAGLQSDHVQVVCSRKASGKHNVPAKPLPDAKITNETYLWDWSISVPASKRMMRHVEV